MPTSKMPGDGGETTYNREVTVMPATSNRNLKFRDEFEKVFPPSSARNAFARHPAFRAVFRNPALAQYESTGDSKPPGQIVAVSAEDFAEGRGDNEAASSSAGETRLSSTGAPKGLFTRITKLYNGRCNLVSTPERTRLVMTATPEGLISAIMNAYNKHCNLVISPDHVWLTILAQFCAYVNRHAEGLRERITVCKGKKHLIAYSVGSLEDADYQSMIRDLLAQIKSSIKSPELADWFRPGFSTTTETDEVCAAATAMASFQPYFTYQQCIVLCGIPSVKLLGTVADWKLLRRKIDLLLDFEVEGNPEGHVMNLFVGYLRKVCDGLVESAENPRSAKTLEFWDKVVSHRGGGSGPRYITGWVSAFTCFKSDGRFQGTHTPADADFPLILTNDICHNVVSCPVKIDDNGVEYEGQLFAGQVVCTVERKGGDPYPTVRPRNDWSMAVAVK